MPYIGYESLMFRKKMHKILQSINKKALIYFYSDKIYKYFNLKDVTIKSLKSSVIYTFKCQVDPDITYIGKTKRHLGRRMLEHIDPNSPFPIPNIWIIAFAVNQIFCNFSISFFVYMSLFSSSTSDCFLDGLLSLISEDIFL